MQDKDILLQILLIKKAFSDNDSSKFKTEYLKLNNFSLDDDNKRRIVEALTILGDDQKLQWLYDMVDDLKIFDNKSIYKSYFKLNSISRLTEKEIIEIANSIDTNYNENVTFILLNRLVNISISIDNPELTEILINKLQSL